MSDILANVAMNAEGFMTDPKQWTKEIAVELAKQEGIDPLTEAHWKSDRFLPGNRPRQWQSPDPAPDHGRRGCLDQGPVRPVPQGPGQEGRQDRRPRQARRLCLSPPIPVFRLVRAKRPESFFSKKDEVAPAASPLQWRVWNRSY